MNCSHCGFGQVPAGTRFCPNCGQPVAQPSEAVTSIQVSQQVGSVQGGTVTGVSIGQVIGNVILAPDDQDEARRRRNLRTLLDKVRSFWIEGVLEHSVQGACLIDLDKEPRPEAVEHPWSAVVPGSEVDGHAAPPAGKIADVFGDSDRSLLILDGAGAGKTVTLLELAQDCAGRADQDPLQPIPVVLNLSTWTQPRQPIADWVVEEMSTRYQIPARIGRLWLESGDLALFLDGLDELDAGRRLLCIEALNLFRQDHGLVPIGICCRTEAYEQAAVHLKLGGAILLQPFTPDQIERYLAAAGPGAAALRSVLQEDEGLRELASSPLMLNMMRLAYQDLPVESLRSQGLDTPEERRDLLLARYVDRMFQQVAGSKEERYTRAQTTHWLRWLARGMQRHGQGVFLVERLQPSWLPRRPLLWLYALLTRLIAGLLLGLGSVAWGYLLPDLRSPAWGYLVLGAVGGLLVGIVDGLRFAVDRPQTAAQPTGQIRLRRPWNKALAAVVYAGLAAMAIYVLRWTQGWIFGLKEGLMFSLFFGLLMGWRNSVGGPSEDTRTVERLAWSPRGSLQGALAGLGTSALMALAFGLVSGVSLGWPAAPGNTLVFLSIFGPTLGLIGALLGGLRGTLLETRTLPNQGIRLSARNATLLGLTVGLVGGISEGTINVLIGRILHVASAGLGTLAIAGLFWGMAAALWYGGLDLIKHYCLRVILWLTGCLPWNCARFLDYAADRILLQRAGGSYLFTNRLLLSYFAQQGSEPNRSP